MKAQDYENTKFVHTTSSGYLLQNCGCKTKQTNKKSIVERQSPALLHNLKEICRGLMHVTKYVHGSRIWIQHDFKRNETYLLLQQSTNHMLFLPNGNTSETIPSRSIHKLMIYKSAKPAENCTDTKRLLIRLYNFFPPPPPSPRPETFLAALNI